MHPVGCHSRLTRSASRQVAGRQHPRAGLEMLDRPSGGMTYSQSRPSGRMCLYVYKQDTNHASRKVLVFHHNRLVGRSLKWWCKLLPDYQLYLFIILIPHIYIHTSGCTSWGGPEGCRFPPYGQLSVCQVELSKRVARRFSANCAAVSLSHSGLQVSR